MKPSPCCWIWWPKVPPGFSATCAGFILRDANSSRADYPINQSTRPRGGFFTSGSAHAPRSVRLGEGFPRGFGVAVGRASRNPGFGARRESTETPFSGPWCHARRRGEAMVFPTMRAGIVGRFGGSRESFPSPSVRPAVQPHPTRRRQSHSRRPPKKPLVKRELVELWGFFNLLPRFSLENAKNCLFFTQGHKPR